MMVSKDLSDIGMFILSIAKFVWGIGLTVYVFFANRKKALERIRMHWKKRIEEAEGRLTCLESDVKHLPSTQDIKDLAKEMGNLSGSLNKFEGRLEGLNRAVDLINEHLINH